MNKLRNSDFSVTDEANAFGYHVTQVVEDLFSEGKKEKFSMRDIFTVIVHAVFKYYYIYLYEKEIEMAFPNEDE